MSKSKDIAQLTANDDWQNAARKINHNFQQLVNPVTGVGNTPQTIGVNTATSVAINALETAGAAMQLANNAIDEAKKARDDAAAAAKKPTFLDIFKVNSVYTEITGINPGSTLGGTWVKLTEITDQGSTAYLWRRIV
jgi:hypothetical protein